VIAAAKKLEAYLNGEEVTDLKAANQMLANAIAALESPEHDADVSRGRSHPPTPA
jgi:hypothetical protein